MEKKKDIRSRILEERNLMSHKDWWKKSHNIYEQVTTHPFFLDTDELYCYIDVRNEVGTKELIEKAWALGKKVAAPLIKNDEMNFYYFHSFDELNEDAFHIPAPIPSHPATNKDALVIMPGAVFDRHRHRIGYGKGFYDRYLAKNPQLKTIAVAFEFQVMEDIPHETHDVCPNYLITEEKIYGDEFTEGSYFAT